MLSDMIVPNTVLPLTDKTPEERAKLLETTPLFANIHADAAAAGQTSVPDNLDTDLHFTCFVQTPQTGALKTETPAKTMRLIELDGARAGPVDRGECTDLLRVRRVDKCF
jgi:ubiquitin carboxyl-terminal hydrolase L3